eukprot:6728230-Pyramimonas_sp.AAC.1
MRTDCRSSAGLPRTCPGARPPQRRAPRAQEGGLRADPRSPHGAPPVSYTHLRAHETGAYL